MKDEVLNYLTKDIISLYKILEKMEETIYKNYRINITNKPTIASLSMAILRSNFLEKSSCLPQSNGKLENAIRSSLFGGRNEIFKPLVFGILGYDYNSLYPSAMLHDLPIGRPVYSLCKDLNKIFGFVKVRVKSPDNIYIPVLPVRIFTKSGGEKLIFPKGN